MSPCVPMSSAPPPDLITVAFCPNNTSVWNPALRFVGSYAFSNTTPNAFRVNRFCRRSYSRPTIIESPLLWPE